MTMLEQATEIRHLDLATLVVPGYQRGTKGKVPRMVRNWNPQAAGVLLVCERDNGELALVDGLQRKTAMERLGITSWDCEIIHLDSYVAEARMFLDRNDRTGMNSNDLFRAHLEAEDRAALALQRIVHNNGFRLAAIETGVSGHPLNAIVALQYAYKKEALGHVLGIIKEVWGNQRNPNRTTAGITQGSDGQFIKGLSNFLAIAKEQLGDVFDMNRLKDLLSGTTPGQLIGAAHALKATSHGDRPLLKVLASLYNGRLGRDKRVIIPEDD